MQLPINHFLTNSNQTMSAKTTEKNLLQKAGIAVFAIALAIFTGSLTMSAYRLNEEALKTALGDEYQWSIVQQQLDPIKGKEYGNSFAFMNAYEQVMKRSQEAIKVDLKENLGLTGKDKEYWNSVLQDYKVESMRAEVAKASSRGLLPDNAGLIFFLSIIMGMVGALMYILPRGRLLPGIKNNHVFHSGMHNRGLLGIATGIFLIGFYVVLYFYPEHMVNWVILVDPVSEALRGAPADRWFLYGFLYTLVIIVMGVRMILKYRHSNYQILRTFSVIFFQTAFAFLIPQILSLLNQPSVDLKNIWPLDYSFFFEYRLNELMRSGSLGVFMLVWGMALIVIGVPVITYFYGKRWYCSWVCGCGGLAETLGDPYRQLSDKRLGAWRAERWIIHGVLVFAVVMTIAVLYTYLPKADAWFTRGRFIWGASLILLGITGWLFTQQKRPNGLPRTAVVVSAVVAVAITAIAFYNHHFEATNKVFFVDHFQIRKWYGFAIGSIFAGVVGTGFYPLMGNRVWCRFGCPLAAYLGLVQKLKSRFRITTNGGQCISCGNCSTYCEMGIDVRWYAQRGQDVVRSSCVGCGICAAVCPRGVLRLENSSEDVNTRTTELRALHIAEGRVSLANE
jgi:polyferredoxin